MIDPNEIYERLTRLGKEWVDKSHAATWLDESKKSVLSQIMTEGFLRGDSATKAECYALADQRYIDHIHAMVDAEREANLARVNYDAARAWSEALRTRESTERALMKI